MNDNDRLWLAGVCRAAELPEDAWMTKERKRSPSTAVRDVLLTLVGLLGLVYELVLSTEPRLVMVFLFAAMLGMPHSLAAVRK